MSALRGNSVSTVWLVSDGYGGHLFDLCQTRADANEVFRFHRRVPGIRIREMKLMHFEIENDRHAVSKTETTREVPQLQMRSSEPSPVVRNIMSTFGTLSSSAIRRIINCGERVIRERTEDGVFD